MEECPLGLFCSLVSEDLEECDNEEYCQYQAQPWPLPYEYGFWHNSPPNRGEEKFKTMRVEDIRWTYGKYSPDVVEELEQLGWSQAFLLPYKFEFIDGIWAMVVNDDVDLKGKQEPDYHLNRFAISWDLPYDYNLKNNCLTVKGTYRPWRYEGLGLAVAERIPCIRFVETDQELSFLKVVRSCTLEDGRRFEVAVDLPKYRPEDFDYNYLEKEIREAIKSESYCYLGEEISIEYEGWDGGCYGFRCDVYLDEELELEEDDDGERFGYFYFDSNLEFEELTIE